MKRIIFCADGTWDDPQSATNVYGLYKAIPLSSDQVALYDDGVGSDGTPLQKLTGGAFGDGLFQKIKDGYTKICHVYDEGDEIFIFGFSRGAYTARSLAGMIAVCGLPTENFDNNLVNDAFAAYRNKDQRAAFQAKYNLPDAKIKMVGVWDTVGALGIPAIFGGIEKDYAFLDTTLHPDVLNAYQALAIDERRQEFPPTLWTLPNLPTPGQVIKQVWFAGVHCDVGGGYADTSLSDITLSWMVGNATALGLELDAGFLAEYGLLDGITSLDQIHESWNLLWLLPRVRTVAADADLGNSVAIRLQYDTTYRPENLKIVNGALAGSYPAPVPVVKPPLT